MSIIQNTESDENDICADEILHTSRFFLLQLIKTYQTMDNELKLLCSTDSIRDEFGNDKERQQ